MLKNRIFILIVLSLFLQESIFADKKKITVQDLLKMDRVENPVISPDGKWIAYTIKRKEKWDSDAKINIWLVSVDGKKSQPLTSFGKNNTSPSWSPDGSKVAFLCDSSGKKQIYYITVKEKEVKKVSDYDHHIVQFSWYKGSQHIVVNLMEERDSVLVDTEEKAGGGYVVGTQFKKSALWIQNINGEKPTRVTDGSYYIREFDPSPDGNYFLVNSTPNSDYYYAFKQSTIKLLDKQGKELVHFKEGNVLHDPKFSPNSQKFAFVGCGDGLSSDHLLFVGDVATKKLKELTREFDPTIGVLKWYDDNHLIFSTPRNVNTGIYKVNINGTISTVIAPTWVIGTFSFHANSKMIAFAASSNQSPDEIYAIKEKQSPKAVRKLTKIHDDMIGKFFLASSKIIKFKSYDGVDIEAVVGLPPDYKEGNKYPIIVLPHGGPDGIIQDKFSRFAQIFCAEGFIVYEPNFRGSIGYGYEFYAANRNKLGDIDYKDIMWGLNHLILLGMVDTTKMVVGGWSYGGYMTNWIIGHTNRFKAGVSVAGVCNTISNYGQGDINYGEVALWEFKGVPAKNMENFIRTSPIFNYKNCTTPTLFLHGEKDVRVHVAQGWESYRALKDMNVDTEFVIYPGAAHSIRAPKQFANVMTRWVNWYKKYLKME